MVFPWPGVFLSSLSPCTVLIFVLFAIFAAGASVLFHELRLIEGGQDHRIKHLLEVLLGEGGALHVRVHARLLHLQLSLVLSDGTFSVVWEFDQHLDIVTQVALCTHQDDGRLGTMFAYFGQPFVVDVVEGRRRDDTEADEEHVRLGVTQRPQLVKVILKIHRDTPFKKKRPVQNSVWKQLNILFLEILSSLRA